MLFFNKVSKLVKVFEKLYFDNSCYKNEAKTGKCFVSVSRASNIFFEGIDEL